VDLRFVQDILENRKISCPVVIHYSLSNSDADEVYLGYQRLTCY